MQDIVKHLLLPIIFFHPLCSGSRVSPISVRWSHATNSERQLHEAIHNDHIDFLEADILMGKVIGEEIETAIMAHPPNKSSDISLLEWMKKALQSSKGIKLDFKDIVAAETGLVSVGMLLKSDENASIRKLLNELWLNADIYPGPGGSSDSALNAQDFCRYCVENIDVPFVFSLGWTTKYTDQKYTQQHIDQMKSLVTSLGNKFVYTFPIRASLIPPEGKHVSDLLDMPNYNTTLTIWSSASDIVDFKPIQHLLAHYPDRMYFDLPDGGQREMLEQLIK